MWRKLKFVHMWINFKFLHMTDVEKSKISFILCTIYGILIFLATIQDHSRTPQNMFYYWSGVLIAYIIELNKFLRGTKRKICFAHYRCISRQNNGGNFLCGKKGRKGGGVSEGVLFFRRNSQFFEYLFDAILSFLNISLSAHISNSSTSFKW